MRTSLAAPVGCNRRGVRVTGAHPGTPSSAEIVKAEIVR